MSELWENSDDRKQDTSLDPVNENTGKAETSVPPSSSQSLTSSPSSVSSREPSAPSESAEPAQSSQPTSPQPEYATPPYTPPQSYTPPQPQYTPYNRNNGYNGYYSQPGYSSYNPQPPKKPKKKKNTVTVVIAVLAVLCCVSLIATCVLGWRLITSDSDTTTEEVTPPTQSPSGETKPTRAPNENGPTLEITGGEDADDGGLTTREIVAENLDSTVVLTTYTRQNNGYFDSPFNDYINPDLDTEDNLVQASESSGIVLSADGYIITNSHCVIDEDSSQAYERIDVTMYNGTVYESARIIGYDTTTDLAVIKVDANDLQPATFGDSSAVSLGDRVVTLGNSGGLHWSASQGILSGQARDVYEDTGYSIKCLQVDAVINPGSSGGPLLNNQGQVIGINSAKIVLSGYEGLGFSIPINEAKTVIDDLVKYGYVKGRVSLGITGSTVTSIGYEGFIIRGFQENSALLNTDAKEGDIITHVDGTRVNSYEEMRTELTKHQVGDQVTLTLLRLDNQSRTSRSFDITVTLMESNN